MLDFVETEQKTEIRSTVFARIAPIPILVKDVLKLAEKNDFGIEANQM